MAPHGSIHSEAGGAARRSRGRAAGIILLAALLGACASGRDPESATQPTGQPTTLRIDNRSTLDATVYVVRGGQSHRLGMVTGSSTTVLPIPDSLIFGVTRLSFQVDPVGSRQRMTSYEFNVIPGEQVQLIFP